ncbi:glycosyltransferase family 2 protein [Algibacter lectus]|uniref:glycosyltransferase family 2 protein n=1 Tax=Algibacter lectus TaxID=221126 RepID=UPI0026F095E2|nr:glycosyltransferase family 2 protein [Algibacter lectus]MDO7135393.1 glycosyltransferase family 2 protein [Algibacter lectus]
MTNKPLITVLIPTYNCDQYVKQAVQSILEQTYTNFECIIIDDCSTDGTVDIIKTFNDPRINLIVKPKNSGYTNSLNFGLTIAKGKYIARMDGDDISLSNRFEKQVYVLEQNDDMVVCGSIFRIIDTETIIQAPEYQEQIKTGLLKDSCIGHPTAMIKLSVLQQHNINYNKAYEPAEDYDLWVRLSQVGQLHNIQEVLFLYRVHDNQVSITKKEIQRKSASLSRFNMLSQLDFDYSELEKQAYIKQFSFTERLNFKELKALINLNSKALKANSSGFFDPKKFKTIIQTFQAEAINQYFKANNTYSPKYIGELKVISQLTDVNFSFSEKVKLYIKALIFFNNNKV